MESIEFKPSYITEAKPTPKRCKATVHSASSIRPHQCNRKPWKDGWCKQHHPDTVNVRVEKKRASWARERDLYDARVRLNRLEKLCADKIMELAAYGKDNEVMELASEVQATRTEVAARKKEMNAHA